jgi:hypothetical protein
MNQQPDQYIINIVSIVFALLVLYYAATTKNTTNIFTNDMVDILYEVKPKQIENYIVPQKKAKQNKIKPKYLESNFDDYLNKMLVDIEPPQPQTPIQHSVEKTKVTLTQKTFSELHHDCVNALMSLGMKKRESVNTVIRIFNKYEIESIEDFIKKAFVPDEYYRSST